jgi:fructose-1,6-bisphosphatase/inositol monophosphatase family enzyme
LWDETYTAVTGGGARCNGMPTRATRADAFWATNPGRWDFAAGLLLATEAGACVTDLQGRPVAATAPTILAAAPAVHGAVLGMVGRDR